MNDQSSMQTLVNRLSAMGLSRKKVFDYSALLSGQLGRLVFSMIYFIALARALSLGDFGIFATCSSIGIVLSRLSGLGFVSPLFRVATVRPRLIGVYTTGFLVASLFTLPILLLVGLGIHAVLYSDLISIETFLFIVMAEILLWRGVEAVIIVNNGLGRYALGSAISIGGVAAKAAAAFGFWYLGDQTLESWAPVYFAVMGCSLLVSVALFYPRQKLKWRPKAWFGRIRDALGVSAAEALFFTQSELDKVLVLAFGGEVLAGLYAIVMRLVDLTAMPLRAFATMLTQWIMRARQSGNRAQTGLKLDAGLGLVSVAGLLAIAIVLSIAPTILGENIALGASYLWLVLLVPAFRNAIELHTELLYGHERMAPRVMLLACLTVLKACLLILLLRWSQDFEAVALWLNVVFGVLYLVSAVITYGRVLGRDHGQAVNR